MKKQNHLFQKKYSFFQKSFFDFLYWRSTKNLNSYSIHGKHFNSVNKFYPFEQEKICFYEYWKSSEHFKIQNTLKSSTLGFQNSKFCLPGSFSSNSSEVFDKPKEKKYFFRNKKKNKKFLSMSKKSLHFLTTQKFHFIFLKKRREKFINIQNKNSKTVEFFPKNSFFEISQNFHVFESQKIGEFFPKKKNFIQYWIFPFLGVLFFFSQNSSFLFLQKEKKLQSFFSFQSLQILNKGKVSDFFLKESQIPEKKSFFLSENSNEQKKLEFDNKENEFSFAQKNRLETHFLQNFEKTEYEEFLKFSTKIFQNTISFFPLIDEQNFLFQQGDKNDEKIYFTKTSVLQKNFQKKLERQRNCFHWKWFSLNSNFLNSNKMIFISSTFHIPQKAEFFMKNPLSFQENFPFLNKNQKIFHSLHGENNFSFDFSDKEMKKKKEQKIQKKNLSTPLFNYSKSLFFIDEFQRNFCFLNSFDFFFPVGFQKSHDFDLKIPKFDLPSQRKIYEMQKLFQNKEFLFSNSLWTKSQNSFALKNESNKGNSSFQKNLFFLKNWAKTQKFSTLVSFEQNQNSFNKSFHFHKDEKSSFFDQKTNNKFRKRKFKERSKNFEKLMNLDALYFQKLFQNFQKQKFQKTFEVQTFLHKKDEEKKLKKFLKFKKQTFDFFLFQHCTKNHRKLYHFLSYKKEKSKMIPFYIEKEKRKAPFFLNLKTNRERIKLFRTIPQCSFFKEYQKAGTKKSHSFKFFLKNQKKMNFMMKKDKNFSVLEKMVFHSSFLEKSFLKKTSLFQFHQPILFHFSSKEDISEKLQNSSNENKKNVFTFFIEKPFFSPFKENFQKFFPNDRKIEFHSNFTVYPKNFYGQYFDFSFFPYFEQNHFFRRSAFLPAVQEKNAKKSFFFEKTINFAVQFSKYNFFENFQEKLFQNFSKIFSLNISKFESFQKNFLFETSHFQRALLFHKTKNIFQKSNETEKSPSRLSSVPFDKMNFEQISKTMEFQSPNLKTKKTETLTSLISSQFVMLKSKKKFSFLHSQINKKGISSSFSGFSKKQRKFEKVFRAFFSPLKDRKNHFLFRAKKKEKFFIQKTKKDPIFLESLSSLLKKNPQISSFHFFIPIIEKKAGKNIQKKEYKTFFQKKQPEIFEGFQTVFQKSRLSPEFILKRDGFLCISSTKGKKNASFQRLEKEKMFQKKRRLKKEKLETRRRKKRKRFFPRPVWLRMNLYKKFLKTRHSEKLFSQHDSFGSIQQKNRLQSSEFFPFQINTTFFESWFPCNSFNEKFVEKKGKFFKTKEEKQLNSYFLKKFQAAPLFDGKQQKRGKNTLLKTTSDFQIYNVDSLFFKKQNSTFQSKTYQQNHQKENWIDRKMTLHKSFYSNFGAIVDKNFFPNNKETREVSKNIQQYKISSEIFQEFLRFSWKFSWFQSNFKPYTKTIQENFHKIQSLESQKIFSKFFDFLPIQTKEKPENFLLHTAEHGNKSFVYFFHNFPVFSEQSQNDFLVRKSVFQKFSWYSSIQTSFSSRNKTNFIQKNSENFDLTLSTDKNQKIPEYNRILYARISEVLKKFKFSENMTNESFFQSFQVNRRKNEKIFSSPSGQSPGVSNNSFFTKTALFFEKFQVPSEPVIPAFSVFSSLFNDFSIKPTGDIPTLRALWAFQKTNYSHFQEKNAVQNLWAFKKRKDIISSFKGTKKIMNFFRKYNGFEKPKTPQQLSPESGTNLFLLSKKGDFSCPLDMMTFQKFQNIEKKSSLFGIQSLKQNSKISYRYLKFHLAPLFQNQKKFSSDFQGNKKREILPAFSTKSFKENNIQNSAKSSVNFWWAQKPFQIFDFSGTSQFQTFHEFSNKKTLFLHQNEFLLNIFSEKLIDTKILNKEKKRENFFFSDFSFFQHSVFQSGFFLVFGAFFFHFAIFYTIFKIPEIRSVFKFTLLLFSKIWKSFFLIFFSIYNVFKKYTKNGLNLLKKSSAFTEKKTFHSQSFFDWNINQSLEKISVHSVSLNHQFQTERLEYFQSFEQNKDSFLSSFWQPEGFQNEKQNFFFPFFENKEKKAKIFNFSFEFYPRFSFFDSGQKKFLQNFSSELHPQTQKSLKSFSFKKEKISGFFLKGKKEIQKNYKQICLQTKIVKNFDSAFLFNLSPNHFSKKENVKNFQFQKNKLHLFLPKKSFSLKTEKEFVNLSKIEKNLSQFALSFLVFGKYVLFLPYSLFKIGSSLFTKIFEIFENVFYAFYKFLEKPAEFMIEFIAFVFLIEWSSDIIGFFPDSIESSMWKSSQKLLRPVRTAPFFLSFGIFFVSTSAKNLNKSSQFFFQTGQNFSLFSPFHFLLSTGFFNFSNFAAYVFQKRFFSNFEHFPSILLQPDIDIFIRQRKGILFWDIWAEILLKAAEKYNVNLPSFVTLKEEQEIFIEKLVQDSQFFENICVSNSILPQKKYFQKQNSPVPSSFEKEDSKKNSLFSRSDDGEKNSLENFSAFLQNFVIQNRPLSLFDFYFSSQEVGQFNFSFLSQRTKNGKLQPFTISNLFLSSFFSESSIFFSPIEQSLIKEQKLFSHGNVALNKQKTFFFHQFFPAGKMSRKKIDKNFSNIQNFSLSPLVNQKRKNKKFFTFFPFLNNFNSLQNFGQISMKENRSDFRNFKNLDSWQFNQYATFQSQETDFFLDIYPPKSLKHVHFLKYYEPAHYTLGSLICQIYAGIFSKQISKNILVIGEAGTAKTFFLRALAGETEMKIITENASRYATVQRGVAVGMKYLRDVFDAIALQTPCFFVMEDLHIIGSKRPFMISENENNQNIQSSFGLEQQEVHETNQMIYQSSRHSLSDFRRPYKGDFSMGIPANFFLQTFYSSFFSKSRNTKRNLSESNSNVETNHGNSFYPIQKGPEFQNSQFFGGNFSSNAANSLSSPLPIDSLDIFFQKNGIQEKEMNNFDSFSGGAEQKNRKKVQSCLQFSKEQIFAPPATSPFTVLMMKEQKKLKPKKIVQETSWGGLSADQILLYQKENSSIRAKVAVFAEKTLNLSRGKFDMITDFLVILDSVRSNRGFVVFGTTHKPSALDPALRRPGRFDETLLLSRSPNIFNRFEILKMNLENSVSTFDFFDSSILTENFSEMDLFDILCQTKLSFLHNYKYVFQKSFPLSKFEKNSMFFVKQIGKEDQFHLLENKKKFQTGQNFTIKKQLYSQTSPVKAFQALLKSPIFEDFYTQKQFTFFSSKETLLPNNFSLRNQNYFSDQKYALLPNGPSHLLTLAYSKLGTFLAESTLLKNPTSYTFLKFDIDKNSSKHSNFQQFYGNVFYDSQKERDLQLLVFLSGKIAEFLSQKNIFISFASPLGKRTNQYSQNSLPNQVMSGEKGQIFENFPFNQESSLFENPYFFFLTKFGVFESSFQNFQKLKNRKSKKDFFSTKVNFLYRDEQKNSSFSSIYAAYEKPEFSHFANQKNFYWTVYGNEENWRSATPFLFSIIQKRFLFTKNLLLSKMLFFENMDQRRKPPSPPGSSILMPAKKYENLKRVEADFFKKAHFSIHEKIQMHQKQRFLKQLYNIPVEKYFHSELRRNHKTLFSSSFQEFAYLDSFVEKTSSIHSYYKKYIQVRHRFSNVHLWWNGMFPEHTRETTYLSDVDWRTMFVSPPVGRDGQKEKLDSGKTIFEDQKKSSNQTFEFLMDFPDSEQYYNPRNRRWFFKFNFNSDIFDSHFSSNEFGSKVLQKKSKNGIDSISVGKTNSTFWALFEKDLQYEIFSHFLMESFYQSFSYFDKKREMLDFFVFHFLSKGFLKEFDFLTTFSRF